MISNIKKGTTCWGFGRGELKRKKLFMVRLFVREIFFVIPVSDMAITPEFLFVQLRGVLIH